MESTKPTFRGVLEDILAGLEAGEYMYTTMEYYENIFPYIYINMIKVGELSGSLTQSLQQAVKYLDTSTDTSKKLKKNNNSKCNTIGSINSIIICRKFIHNTYNTIQNVYDEVGTKDTLPGITIAFSHVIEWIAAHWYVPALE